MILSRRRYNMNYIIKHIRVGHPNRPGYSLKDIKAIVVHYTQNDIPQADALFHFKYLNRPYVIRYDENERIKFFEQNGFTSFRFGSAHVFCDMDNVVETIPLDEVAWGCGDKNYNGGYKNVAYTIFKSRQNFHTINIEICNNNKIKNSLEDWDKAVENAKKVIEKICLDKNFKINIEKSLIPQKITSLENNEILLLRHYDITGKLCPKPFIDDLGAWKNFLNFFS